MKGKRPLIGLTADWQDRYFRQNEAYSEMAYRAGGEPVILPFQFDRAQLLGGLILTGGGDVTPELGRFGAEGAPINLSPAGRDESEFLLFAQAWEAKRPVLGICRGHQIVNCALGGSLFRDIPEAGFAERHGEGYHPVATLPGTLARAMLGERSDVWSTHHQAVRDAGAGFSITARSPEGVVEAIEHESGLILGLQTHPERMELLAPFEWLIERAR